jgi:hypothetical protein
MNKKATNKDNRENFQQGVKINLFKQVNGQCSVPRCKKPTMGPFKESEGAVNMGVACHIYSAAKDGPRGQGGKDDIFLASEKNGIWCCEHHSALIDKKQGNDYPANNLFAWKELAEARVLKQMNDIPSPLGWVESVELIKFPVFQNPPKIQLSRFTLLWGANESGKSSLLEMAACISDSRHAERFFSDRISGSGGETVRNNFQARVTYSTVDSLSKEINLNISQNELTRQEGATYCLLPPGDLEVIFCGREDTERRDTEDDIDYLSRVLNLDKSSLFALAKVNRDCIMPGDIYFKQAQDDDEDSDTKRPRFKDNKAPYMELRFKKKSNEFSLSFAALSGSEKERLILDLLISKAREVAKQRLTLLLIEGVINYLDEDNFSKVLKTISEESFQAIVTLPYARETTCIETRYGKTVLKELSYLGNWTLATLPDPVRSHRNISAVSA